MNRRTITVTLTAIVAVAAFATAALMYQRHERERSNQQAAQHFDVMVRPHSPVIGPVGAPVTIVEFFDPACESCRAFYPFVKQTLAAFPREARLVIRYTPFHGDMSVEGVRALEAARAQGRFEAVLAALLDAQPGWASHDAPAPQRVWEFARAAGLDVEQARSFMSSGAVDKVLEQDIADVKAVGVRATPTFFVNGKPLADLHPAALHELVKSEAERTRKLP
jgi:protein-disulfide isomerase